MGLSDLKMSGLARFARVDSRGVCHTSKLFSMISLHQKPVFSAFSGFFDTQIMRNIATRRLRCMAYPPKIDPGKSIKTFYFQTRDFSSIKSRKLKCKSGANLISCSSNQYTSPHPPPFWSFSMCQIFF